MTKRILIVFLTLLIAVIFAGCGTYTPPVSNGSQNTGTGSGSGSGNGSGETPGGDDDQSEDSFKVTLMCEGRLFTQTTGISAQWTGTDGIYSAPFDHGVATKEGLDGDYSVTISALPEGFTYDCNGYTANNNKKSIEIELLRIIRTDGNGTGDDKYVPNCVALTKTGTYRSIITEEQKQVFYQYKPAVAGRYTITSWVDIAANEVNPLVDVYGGTSANKWLDHTQDGGGISSSYTKNFVLEIEVTTDEVGNTWTFAVRGTTRTEKYPIILDFSIKQESDFRRDEGYFEDVYASQNFYKGPRPDGTWTFNYRDTDWVDECSGKNILDSERFKLNPDDGYYYLYDEEKYSANNGYGPMLYAMLTHDWEVLITEYMEAWFNAGFTWNTYNGSGFINLKFDGKNYGPFIDGKGEYDGYAQHCNSDGAHPVNEELREFLQAFAISQGLFRDGKGQAEDIELNKNDHTNPSGVKLLATEDDQWLFACGYYL